MAQPLDNSAPNLVYVTPTVGKKRNRDEVSPITNTINKMAKNIELSPDTPEWAITMYAGITAKIDTATQELTSKINAVEITATELNEKVTKVETMSDKLQATVENVRASNSEQNDMINSVKQKNTSLERRISHLENQLLYQESYSRRLNLLFHGFKESAWEDEPKLTTLIHEFLRNTLTIDPSVFVFDNIHRVGRPGKTDKPRGIIVRFRNMSDRQIVWKARPIGNTDNFITQDFPVEIQRRRRLLLPILRAAKTNDDFKDNSYISSDKLVINDRTYTVNDLSSLPEALDPRTISTPTMDGYTFFWGRQSPLSNHYPSKFTVGDTTFNCNEQYYMYHKAMHADEYGLAQEILETDDPVEQRKIGKRCRIRNKVEWNKASIKLMREGLQHKFGQNDDLSDFLIATNDTEIAEASPHDIFWGTGLSMNAATITNKSQWPGKNTLGTMLMELRNSQI